MPCCFDTFMTRRPVFFLAVSALMHMLALTITFAVMTFPFHSLSPGEDVLAVNLVGAEAITKDSAESRKPSESRSANESRQIDADQPSRELREEAKSPDEPEEGVSFEADRKVSTSYLQRLKTKIFLAWKYPEEAIEKGQQGIVRIMFVLDRNGELTAIRVLEGSGSRRLDAASIAAVKDANPFGPLPGDIRDKPLKITGKFCYVLD